MVQPYLRMRLGNSTLFYSCYLKANNQKVTKNTTPKKQTKNQTTMHCLIEKLAKIYQRLC